MIENLKNFDTVKERIYVRLINRKRNEEQLKHLAFIPVLDLAAVFYILADENRREITGCAASQRIYDTLGNFNVRVSRISV